MENENQPSWSRAYQRQAPCSASSLSSLGPDGATGIESSIFCGHSRYSAHPLSLAIQAHPVSFQQSPENPDYPPCFEEELECGHKATDYPIEAERSPHGPETAISTLAHLTGCNFAETTPKANLLRWQQEEARSENDRMVASANGCGRVGTKGGNLPFLRRCGYDSAIPPRHPATPQARTGQGTAPRQALAKSKKSLRRGKAATQGNKRRRECAFSSPATVKDAPGCSGLSAFTVYLGECSFLPGINLCGQGVFRGVSTCVL